MNYSLITGASQGIGRAFAFECAQRGRNLVLVSLPNENLQHLAKKLALQYNVDVACRELNLLQAEAIDELYHWCVNSEYHVDMIINNAGFGTQCSFSQRSYREYQMLMRLNMEAVVEMCYRFLPMLKKQPESYILNLGSIASFMHIPFKAVYSGSKNFVLAFSNALSYELKPYDIKVSTLCPGPTITNDIIAARVQEQGLKAKLVTFTAEKVARISMKRLLQGKRVIIPGIANRFLVKLFQWLPTGWSLKLMGRMFADIQEETPAEYEHKADSKVI